MNVVDVIIKMSSQDACHLVVQSNSNPGTAVKELCWSDYG